MSSQPFCVALLVIILLPYDTQAQIKSWVDKDGVKHYESSGPPPVKSPRRQDQPEQKLSRRIDRTHAGMTLGDNESSFKSSGRGTYRGVDQFGAKLYELTARGLPSGAKSGTVIFLADRITAIEIEYGEAQSGGWDRMIKETTDKYGKPTVNELRKKSWTDGKTGLILDRTYSGTVKALIGDHQTLSNYSSSIGAAAPKF